MKDDVRAACSSFLDQIGFFFDSYFVGSPGHALEYLREGEAKAAEAASEPRLAATTDVQEALAKAAVKAKEAEQKFTEGQFNDTWCHKKDTCDQHMR